MFSRWIASCLWAFGLVAVLWSTLGAEDAPKEAPPANGLLLGEVVTSGEVVEVAQAIEAAAKEGWTELAEHYDLKALVDISFAGITAKEDYRKQFKANFAGPQGTEAVLGPLAKTVKRGGQYTLLRVHQHGTDHAAVFRLNAGSIPNYHILKLVKGMDGKIKVHDLYVLGAGEWMSTMNRRQILPIAASQNRSVLEKLLGTESDFVTYAGEFRELMKAVQADDYATFKDIYDELPKSMQEQKTVLLMRRGQAQKAKQWDDVRATTADFRRLYPNDAALDVLSLPSLIFEKQFDEALAAVDRIDAFVGGDPYLDTLRSTINAKKR